MTVEFQKLDDLLGSYDKRIFQAKGPASIDTRQSGFSGKIGKFMLKLKLIIKRSADTGALWVILDKSGQK